MLQLAMWIGYRYGECLFGYIGEDVTLWLVVIPRYKWAGVEHFLTATSIFIQAHLARPQAQQHKLNKEALRSNGHHIQSLGTERRFWIS